MKKKRIILICSECLNRNYSFVKSNNSIEKLNLNKFCSNCEKHTLHKETR